MRNSHLTLDDRKKIQEGLETELSRTEISKIINKEISTVAKEIKHRRKLKPRNLSILLLLVLNLKIAKYVMENVVNMMKLNVQEEIERLVYVISVPVCPIAN